MNFDELDKKTQEKVIDWFRTEDLGVVEYIAKTVKQFKFDKTGGIISKKMKCNKCGNVKDFRLMREMAKFDCEKQLWIEDRLDDEIMCNVCNSFDIGNEEWDFESD